MPQEIDGKGCAIQPLCRNRDARQGSVGTPARWDALTRGGVSLPLWLINLCNYIR